MVGTDLPATKVEAARTPCSPQLPRMVDGTSRMAVGDGNVLPGRMVISKKKIVSAAQE